MTKLKITLFLLNLDIHLKKKAAPFPYKLMFIEVDGPASSVGSGVCLNIFQYVASCRGV